MTDIARRGSGTSSDILSRISSAVAKITIDPPRRLAVAATP